MDRGTYIAASGGFLQFRKLEIVNNNLANSDTPGYKGELLLNEVQTFDQTLAKSLNLNDPYAKGDHDRTPGVVNVRAVTDFSPGPMKNTGNPLDVALRNPNDFFVVNGAQGPEYTRAGNFTLSTAGELVTPDGHTVQGDGGALAANGAGVTISDDGTVRTSTGPVGKIQVVRFAHPEVMQRVGATRFSLPKGQPAPEQVEPEIVPQSLEMSNISAIKSVIELITANRGFEMYTKTAQTIDFMNQQAIAQVGKGQ